MIFGAFASLQGSRRKLNGVYAYVIKPLTFDAKPTFNGYVKANAVGAAITSMCFIIGQPSQPLPDLVQARLKYTTALQNAPLVGQKLAIDKCSAGSKVIIGFAVRWPIRIERDTQSNSSALS